MILFLNICSKDRQICEVCHSALGNFIAASRNGTHQMILKTLPKPICRLMDVIDDTICEKIIDVYFVRIHSNANS